MGLNRSFPLPYAASAQKVLDAAPGVGAGRARRAVRVQRRGLPPPRPVGRGQRPGRRRRLARAAATAATGTRTASASSRWCRRRKPGATLQAALVVDNPSLRPEKTSVVVLGRGQFADQTVTLDAGGRGSGRAGAFDPVAGADGPRPTCLSAASPGERHAGPRRCVPGGRSGVTK